MFKRQSQEPIYMENQMIERLFYELENEKRKVRNLNNRLKRIEGFLGLREKESFEDEIHYD